MIISPIVLLVAFVAFSVAVILLPFFRRQSLAQDPQRVAHVKQRAELVAAYERTLGTIRDMDEDYQVGKLAKGEYELNRARWAERGVSLIQAIEALDGKKAPLPTKQRKAVAQQQSADKALDDAMEQAIASYARALSGGQD